VVLELNKCSPENECSYDKHEYSHDPCHRNRTIDSFCILSCMPWQGHHNCSFEQGKISDDREHHISGTIQINIYQEIQECDNQ